MVPVSSSSSRIPPVCLQDGARVGLSEACDSSNEGSRNGGGHSFRYSQFVWLLQHSSMPRSLCKLVLAALTITRSVSGYTPTPRATVSSPRAWMIEVGGRREGL